MYISRERGLEACFDFDSKLSGFAGVLSYGDYLFLLTALISRCYIIQCMYMYHFCIMYVSVETRRQFEIAFRMYDVDNSDFIDHEEFSRVRYTHSNAVLTL